MKKKSFDNTRCKSCANFMGEYGDGNWSACSGSKMPVEVIIANSAQDCTSYEVKK